MTSSIPHMGCGTSGGSGIPSTVYSVFAHRGGSYQWPENTLTAFSAVQAIIPDVWLEMDAQTLSDGTLGIMHDSTVDRTTTGTGNVNTFNATTWAALNIDADAVNGTTAFGNTLHPPTLPAVLSTFASTAARFIIEDKDLVSMNAIMSALATAGIAKNRVILQAFSLAQATVAANAGYDAMVLTTTATSAASIVAAGVKWVGFDYSTTTTSAIAPYVAAGLKVAMFTVERRYIRDQYIAAGAVGFFTDDPVYLYPTTTLPLQTVDKFELGSRQPGMTSTSGVNLVHWGTYQAPDYWGQANNAAAAFASATFGYLSNGSATFTMDFKVTFTSAFSADTTRWVAVWVGDSDIIYTDTANADGLNGYHFLMRKNGSVQIFRRTSGNSPTSLGSTAGTSIADGSEATYRITVNATNVKLQRIDVSTTIDVADATYRGKWFQIGSNGMNHKVHDIVVTPT